MAKCTKDRCSTKVSGYLKPFKQAQGIKLKQSVSWDTDDIITVNNALKMLEELKGKLKPKDLNIRKEAFLKCREFYY